MKDILSGLKQIFLSFLIRFWQSRLTKEQKARVWERIRKEIK